MKDQTERIFLSYRWKDKVNDAVFSEIVDAIEKITGLNVFWDLKALRSGELANDLRKKVATSYLFMPVVTDNYIAFGEEGSRDGDRDYCLFEYETAILNDVRIVPLHLGPEGDKFGPDMENARQAAERTAKGVYEKSDLALLKKYLISRSGIRISSLTKSALIRHDDELGKLVFDQLCMSDKVPYFKDVLNRQDATLNPIRIFGEFDDAGLTLDNSYVPLTFQRHFTQAETRAKEERRESTMPVDQGEDGLLSALASDKYVVVVGDAGQGKSSYAKRLTIDLGRRAQAYGLSRDEYFPLYYPCKNIGAKNLSDKKRFLGELANDADISRAALDTVFRYGKPILIFDAMDEVAPDQMDRLIQAIYDFVLVDHPGVRCLFTSRVGQKLIASGEMTLDHTDATVVRRYTVKALNEAQRDEYISRLADAKHVDPSVKEGFLTKLVQKEEALPNYDAVSRNPFVLMTVFTEYNKGEDLPAARFDAILRVIDNIIARDLNKDAYKSIDSNEVKIVLGAISCELYRQRDRGKPPHTDAEMPAEIAKDLFGRAKKDAFRRFFSENALFDESGFRHEFLASTYAAYYLQDVMERQKEKRDDPTGSDEISVLSHDADYWKSVTEALLCLLDRTSHNSKLYLEPILDKLQEGATPDYETLCDAVSQFTEHQARGAGCLLSKMLARGTKGILTGIEEENDFICNGVNPYEELFYYPAIYPALQSYLPNLPAAEGDGAAAYIHNELRKEVCALFEDETQVELRKLYEDREAQHPDIDRKLQRAAYRTEKTLRGYVRIPKGFTSIGFMLNSLLNLFSDCNDSNIPKECMFLGCSGLTSIFIPEGVTSIGEWAFAGCRRIGLVTTPKSVTCIEKNAFRWCKELHTVALSEGVTTISEGAFADCRNLQSLSVEKENRLYHSAGNCIIHTDTSTLVLGCKASKIPSYVKTIASGAFAGCRGLSSLIIPKSVVCIWPRAFAGCDGLVSLTVEKGNAVYYSDGNCIIHTNSNTLILGCKASKIPSCVTSIGTSSFDGCRALTSLIIPKSVISIGENSFSNCIELTEINYLGATTQWFNIDIADSAFDDSWDDNTSSIAVHCTDGDIVL